MEKQERQALQHALIEWYLANHRDLPWRKTKNPYRIWVSEVMLQQTQVSTVLPYYQKFLRRFPNIQHLARADLQEVLKIWEGMGYYARARNLRSAAAIVLDQHRGAVPQSRQEFRKLPGVGDYIAAAVLSIAFDMPYPVVDGNVKRVLSRLFVMEAEVNASSSNNIYQSAAADILDQSRPGTFNQAMMELGALVCKPQNPFCHVCPLQKQCLAFQSNRTSEFPKKLKKSPAPVYRIAVGVVFKKGRVLITRRKDNGLLGGLWEFPGGKIRDGENPEAACIREIKEEVNLTVGIDSHLCKVNHAYTHFKILMDVFCCAYAAGRVRLKGPVDFRWIRLDQLEAYPLPRANHKFLPQLKEWYQAKAGKLGGLEAGKPGSGEAGKPGSREVERVRRSEGKRVGR